MDPAPQSPGVVSRPFQHQPDLILNAVGIGIEVVNAQGLIVFANPEAARLLGWPLDELLGKSAHRISHHTRADGTPYPHEECSIALARRDGLVHRGDDEIFWRRDGSSFPITYTSAPLRDDTGQIIGTILSFQDITALKQVEAEIGQRRQEADVLAELARNVNASLDLDTVLRRVAAGARRLCHSDTVSLSLRDPHSRAMVVGYWDGLNTPESAAPRVEPGQGAGGQVLVTGRPFRTAHYASDPRVSQDFGQVACFKDLVAVMVVPIWIGGRMEGLLHVANRAARPFTDHDEAILQRLADHTAVAIRNVRLYQQQAQRQAALRTLLDINKQIGQTGALAPLLDTIAREAAQLLDVPVTVVRQREGDDLVLASSWGEGIEMTLLPRLQIGVHLGGLIAAGRQPVIVDDVSHDDDRISPENLAFRRRYGLLAFLRVPLIAGDEILGILTFLGRTGRHFSPAEAEIALAFADQAAIAIQRAQLYAQAKRRLATAESLTAMTQLLSQSLDPAELGQRIVDAIRPLLGAKAALLYQRQPQSGDLHLMAVCTAGASTVAVPRVLPQGTNVAGLAAQTRRPIVSPNVLADPRLTLTPALRAYFEQLPPRTVLSVPLLLDDEVIGVLGIGDDVGREFAEEEIHLVQAFAAQAATALNNARLYQRQRQREEEVRTLLEINKTLGQVRELPALLNSMAAEAARLLTVPEVTFRLCEGSALRLVGAWASAGTEAILESVQMEGTLTGQVAQSGVPLIVNNIAQDDRLLSAAYPRLMRHAYVAYLGVPLRLGTEVIGVMTCNATSTRPFTDHDQEVAVAFADQSAIAVQHARLYAQAEQRRATAESLTAVTQLLSESLDPAEVGQRIVDTVKPLVRAQETVLYQLEPQSGELQVIAFSRGSRPHTLPPGASVAGLAVQTRRPMASPDVLADPRLTLTPELRARLEQGPPRAVLSVPLVLQDEVIGVLGIVDRGEREFAEEEIHLVQAFATQATTSLHNARLYQQQRHREEEVRTLLEINKTLGQVRELPALLSTMAAEAARLLAVPEVIFRLREGATLRLVGSWGQTEAEPIRESLQVGESLSGRVVQSGMPLIINDLERDDRTVPAVRTRLRTLGYNAFLGVPLRLGHEVIGVMACNAPRTRPFTDHDQEVAVAFADQAAIAVQHARLYAELQRAYDNLQQTQQIVAQQERLRALGQMASGIAHDINNALSPISLYVEVLLRSDPTLSARAREYLTTVQQAVQDVAHTIERLREFHRPPTGLREALPVDLNQIVPHVVELTRARWRDQPQQRGITITLHTVFQEHLPRVRGIESELREALINLVFNAIDAMPRGGTLTLQTRATPTAVLVEVRDTGIGMDKITRQRCLEPFYTTKGERGTGLGLAMVYGVLERHTAQLVIKSAVGQGTTMQLRFPIAPDNGAQPAVPAAVETAVAPLRLLIIDDDPLLRQSLQDVLQNEGHVVTVAEGGVAGVAAFRLAQIQQEPFTGVITDLGMPGMDGREVARVVKQASPETPVILLTGWGETIRREGSLPPHVDQLLSKPPKLSDLRAAITLMAESQGGRPGHGES